MQAAAVGTALGGLGEEGAGKEAGEGQEARHERQAETALLEEQDRMDQDRQGKKTGRNGAPPELAGGTAPPARQQCPQGQTGHEGRHEQADILVEGAVFDLIVQQQHVLENHPGKTRHRRQGNPPAGRVGPGEEQSAGNDQEGGNG